MGAAADAAGRMRFERERADPARVFALYADDVYRFCRASGCAAADAEDITAEVFAQALDQLAGLRWRRKPVSAFLYTLARRRVADHFRRRRRELPVAPGDVVERLAAHEDAHLGGPLRVALGNLADRERLAVIVRIVNGYSFAEVAVVLGSSEKAAKSLVYRALDKLEAALDAEGIER